MLNELRIKDFAIIEEISFSFRNGMNVLTGETGAGKSIIIQAINLILGDRAASNLVRNGKKEATVEALFTLEKEGSIAKKLDALGIDNDGELLIRRIISQEGKNKVFINGAMVTLNVLTDLTEGLVSISGQHGHQTLLKPERHIYLLDEFGRLEELRTSYQEIYSSYKKVSCELEGLYSDEKSRKEKADLLMFQLEEIDRVSPQTDEDSKLEEEHRRLANAEKLLKNTSFAEDALYSSEGSMSERLGGVLDLIREAERVDEGLKQIAEGLEALMFQTEDAAMALREYSGKVIVDPERLKSVEERISDLDRLKKKYGPGLEDVIQRKGTIEEELSLLDNSDLRKKGLEDELEKYHREAVEAARHLTGARKSVSAQLSKKIASELEELNMSNARFESVMTPLSEKDDCELNENGAERIEFNLSTNPGEEPKPLAKIASGGELSRIMLALKNCIMDRERTPTLVFDEVDSGIGGGTAEAVGRKIKKVSGNTDVICITHLPQIAAIGDSHYMVKKTVKDGRTFTTIEELEMDMRLEEIARMLGGLTITEKTREHAREMLRQDA
ncbi:MAG: DNA repair protein RecN [Proteobacteria bacterium]|nr:DNA repair protein RecN [Pseudomonadota bacterium]